MNCDDNNIFQQKKKHSGKIKPTRFAQFSGLVGRDPGTATIETSHPHVLLLPPESDIIIIISNIRDTFLVGVVLPCHGKNKRVEFTKRTLLLS